ncbi:MAG: cytochrome c biogenesis protein ResB [Firmicutes bacterium]|nr:cytochrome c biogenesis protein ResB [Bacillota bacterium]
MNFLTGLPFAIILFILIALYSVIGTVLPQGMPADFYLSRYPQFSSLILAFQLNKSYSSIIFFILLGLFVINLVGCTLKILPAQTKRSKSDYKAYAPQSAEELYLEGTDLKELQKRLEGERFAISENEEGYIAHRHRFGNLGSSVTHLGIIVIMIGALVGAIFAEEGFINLLPGDLRNFEEHNFALRLDDFYLEFRDTGAVEQYYSEVTVLRPNQPDEKATLWVNNPLAVKPLNFYQTSYGWAGPLKITNAEGEVVLAKMLRQGEEAFFAEEHLTVYLYGFYPNFTLTSQGEPLTMTEELKNPHYAVILYEFGQHVGSYILEPQQVAEHKDFEIFFDEAKLYTGLTYRKDFGYIFVLLGSLIMLIGLVMSFYFYPKNIIVKSDSIKIASGKNSWGLNFKIKKIISELEKGDKN